MYIETRKQLIDNSINELVENSIGDYIHNPYRLIILLQLAKEHKCKLLAYNLKKIEENTRLLFSNLGLKWLE